MNAYLVAGYILGYCVLYGLSVHVYRHLYPCLRVQGFDAWGIRMAKIREMRLSNFANKPITNAKVLMKEIRRKVSTANNVLMWRPTKHQVASAFRRFHHVASGTQTIDLKDFNVSYCLAHQPICACMSPG